MKNKDLNIDLKSVSKELKQILSKFKRYSVVLAIVIIVGLYAYLVMQISSSATTEPSQAQVAEELGAVKRLRIDQESIDKIQQLEDQNIVVQSLFEEARDNPFSE